MKLADAIRVCNTEIPEEIAYSRNESYGAYNIDDVNRTVKRALYCVTPNPKVVAYFKKHGYDLLISHHPYVTKVPQLVYHTALDCCEGGLNDMWRDHLDLKVPCKHFDGTLGWYGEIEPLPYHELALKVKRLSGKIIGETFSSGGPEALIKTVVICSGLGGLVVDQAYETGADCYIIGQNTLPANMTGFKGVIETGHTASEWIGIRFFQRILAGIQVDLAPEEIDIFGEEVYQQQSDTSSTSSISSKCQMCEKRMQTRYRLYDREGSAQGDFCSKLCAEADAWGPIFRPYKVRKLPASVL